MSEINTFAALKAGGPLEPWQYVPRELGENDVRLEIECCGICHSDIHRIDNGWSASPTTYPFVGGHEIVGKVVQKGKNVAMEIGTRVGVGPQSGACFECETCKAGRENYCPKKFFTYNSKDYTGHQTYGGYADAIVVDHRFAFEIPESLESTAAAPLLCAGLTVYAPLAEFDVKGKRVGVLSCGGLGHMAIQIAKHMNAAEVVVISTSENKKDLAMKLGATKFVVSTDPKQMKECEGSLDFLLSCAAFDLDWNGLLKLLAEHGMLHCVGVPEEEFHVNLFHLIGQRRRIGGSLIGNRQQMKDMLNFCAENKISAMISEVGDMKDATKHVETCRQGKAKFRIVLKN